MQKAVQPHARKSHEQTGAYSALLSLVVACRMLMHVFLGLVSVRLKPLVHHHAGQGARRVQREREREQFRMIEPETRGMEAET